MIRLHLLGNLALTSADGVSIRSILTRPKRFALLAHLACVGRESGRPRDILLGLFWPDLDEDRARRALRQALYGLRQSLGPGVMTGKGEELVGLDPERLWCDAAAFSRALDEGRSEEALELYRGPFLDGFHLSGAPEFERWVERRRRELRLAAARASWGLAERSESAGHAADARRWADRAVKLVPYDEDVVRRYLELMNRLGQPAAAIRAYRAYAARLRDELELEPSEETRALVEAIRRGGGTADPADDRPEQAPAGDGGIAREPARPPGEAGAAAGADTGGDTGDDAQRAGGAPAPSDPGPAGGGASARNADTGSTKRRRVATIAVPAILIVIVLAAAALSRMGRDDTAAVERPIRSVAVLPLVDMSPEDQQWFGDGIAEEIVDALVKIEPLTVVGRSSSFQFRGASPDIRMVGDSLDVGAVLEGSVRRAGERVRITVQLVRTSDAGHLWSRSYERELTPEAIFEVQEEIARSVAGALRVELGLRAPGRLASAAPADLEAYSLYLRARSGMRERTPDGRRRARALIGEALAIDSTYARAWALSALLRVREPFWEHAGNAADFEEMRRRARDDARRAVTLAPDLAEAHSTLGHVLDQEHRWAEARRHHRRAVELSPGDPDLRALIVWHLAATGDFERALEEARIRQRLDPLYTPANGNLAAMLMYAGRVDDALTQWRLTIARSGGGDAHSSFVRTLYAKALALQGRTDRAVSEARAAYESERDRGEFRPRESYYLSQLAAMLALNGELATARSLLDTLRIRSDRALPESLRSLRAFDRARVHAALGQTDSAFHWLGRSRPERWRGLEAARFQGDPWWAPIRDDPRYERILRDALRLRPGRS